MEFPEKTFEFNRLFHDEDQNFSIASVWQIGESAVISGAEMWTHEQWCDEIVYVLFGSATVYSGNAKNQIHAGDFHYIKKGVTHKISVNPDEKFRYFCIGFEANGDCEAVASFVEAVKNIDYFVGDGKRLHRIIEALVGEAYNEDKDNRAMISSYLFQLMITLSRIIANKERLTPKDVSLSNQDSQRTLYRVLKYIDNEYKNIKTVKDIAHILSYNECYLSHMFRQKMGITIKEYLLNKKIRASAELLKTSNMTIDEISSSLGFGSANSFARAFKRLMSISPQNYRNIK